jgi:hypothetical protein
VDHTPPPPAAPIPTFYDGDEYVRWFGSSEDAPKKIDLAGRVACRRFADLGRSVRARPPNFDELRPALTDLYAGYTRVAVVKAASGQPSTTPGLEAALQQLLEGVMRKDAPAFAGGVDRVTTVCAAR